MSISIYIDGVGDNVVGAVAEGKKLIEYRVEKVNKTVAIGSVFLGKVMNVLEGMQACFVNVGLDRNGYLSAGDMLMDRVELNGKVEIPSILDLKEGDEIMVQAVKDPSETKGVRLTSNISFAGRYVVYMPTIDFIGVSRKITDEKHRDRLLKVAKSICRKGQGVIIRTAGETANKREIKKELDFLAFQYDEIVRKSKKAKAPSLLYEEGDLAVRFLRDVYSEKVDKFVVSDKETYKKILDYSKSIKGEIKKKLVLYNEKTDMLSYFGLKDEVGKLLKNKVDLPSGAYLVIDKTEALTVIDVNTGRFTGEKNLEDTVYKTNLTAADEIARQLRLRNISGIIVVDFIDMEKEEHREKLLERLDNALQKDREKCTVVGMSSIGLVEITRKKRRRESVSPLVKTCPYCQGTGLIESNDYIVMKIRTGLLDVFGEGYESATVDLNVEIADYILKKGLLKKDVEKIWGEKRIYIIPHKTYHQQFFLIKGSNDKILELPDKAVLLY